MIPHPMVYAYIKFKSNIKLDPSLQSTSHTDSKREKTAQDNHISLKLQQTDTRNHCCSLL